MPKGAPGLAWVFPAMAHQKCGKSSHSGPGVVQRVLCVDRLADGSRVRIGYYEWESVDDGLQFYKDQDLVAGKLGGFHRFSWRERRPVEVRGALRGRALQLHDHGPSHRGRRPGRRGDPRLAATPAAAGRAGRLTGGPAPVDCCRARGRRPDRAHPRHHFRRRGGPEPRPAVGGPGPQGRRVRTDPRDPRSPADQLRARDVQRHVERALLLQELEGAPQAVLRDPAGDADREDAGRHRRERRRHRHRPGLRRHVQDRVAQPSVVRRALPGRRDRRRRHRPRHPRHGRPAGRRDGPAALRPARLRRHPPGAARDRGGGRRLRQLPRPAQHRWRGGLRRQLPRQPARQRPVRRGAAPRGPAPRQGQRHRQPGAALRRQDRWRRDRRGHHPRQRDLRKHGAGQAPQRPGRRPVHGEAAHRVHPRAVRGRAGQRHPGPRRRRPVLRDVRARLRG